MLIPMAVMARLGIPPLELGLSLRGTRRELAMVAVFFAVMVPLLLWASRQAPRRLPQLFAYVHLAYLVKWIAREFFFRGFLLFGFGVG